MAEKTATHSIDAGKSPEQLFAERTKRIDDAVQLKQPDRIPLIMGLGYLLSEMGGITKQELYDNPVKAQELLEMAAHRFQPDSLTGVWHTPFPSKAVGDRMTKWPGYGLDANGSFQFIEQEFMKAEDYDDFLDDPSDWAIRVYTPRVFKKAEGLALLPPLGMWLYGYYNMVNYPALLAPPVLAAFEAINKAAQLNVKWLGEVIASTQRMAELGFAPMSFLSTLIEAPFDFMSDTLRGMRGIFLDMLRCPDKLLAAEEKVSRFQIKHALANAKATGIPTAFIPLHRGSDGFMSLSQFETFYWPQLKHMMETLVENGITPWVFYEGTWDDRLQYLAELPKGKTVGIFQNSDIFKVKEVVGNTLCIVGGMPLTLFKGCTPEQVRAHTRKVCEEVGKGGGFIFCTAVLEMEGCEPDLVQAWTDAVREFGVY